MTKHTGLSQLADTARELANPRNAPYPVKEKHQPRRLLPNWLGIAWLESDENEFHDSTRTETVRPMSSDLKDLTVHRAFGSWRQQYTRPMIQILHRDAFSTAPQKVHPCPVCDRWDRTARCTDHPERTYDTCIKDWVSTEQTLEAELRAGLPERAAWPHFCPCGCGTDSPLPPPPPPAPSGNTTITVTSESVTAFTYQTEPRHA